MSPARKKKAPAAEGGIKVVATNRQARRNYEILETVECGLVLQGSEVKSLRMSKVQITDAYGRIDSGEMWLHALHIAPYSHAGAWAPDPERKRKLLLHRDEIDRLRSKVDQEHLALIPLSIYFRKGRAKVDLGLGRGRKHYDKRHVIAKRDAERETARELSRSSRKPASD